MMRPMRMGPRPRVCLSSSDSGASHGASAHPLMDGSLATAGGVEFEPALQAFREALSLPPPSSKSASSAGRRASPVHNHNSELSAFISHESARHKRPAPPSSGTSPSHDVTMDSPTHKRSRLMWRRWSKLININTITNNLKVPRQTRMTPSQLF